MIYIRKNNSKLFLKLRELKATYIQHAEVGENCFILWKSDPWGLMFRACTVAYAKSQKAKDFGKDVDLFLLEINNL
jgi:hypothetical protein